MLTNYKIIGLRIRELRLEKRMTQADLAENTDMSTSTLYAPITSPLSSSIVEIIGKYHLPLGSSNMASPNDILAPDIEKISLNQSSFPK